MTSIHGKLGKLSNLTISNVIGKEQEQVKDSQTKNDQIAIIGMSGKCGTAETLGELWKLLVNGEEGVRVVPENRRKDVEDYMMSNDLGDDFQYINATFLDDIAGFDYKFFGLSYKEAVYMDPNQRMLLETVWKAFEDAGKSEQMIRKTNTGVYVGFSNDFGVDYRNLAARNAQDAVEVAVSGNIKSIIASRISYLLDLRGPAIMIDTACSSGLVAMHQAVQALRRKECSMAVVGAVSCMPFPIIENGKTSGMGIVDIQNISTADYHNRTFDDRCQGTYYAEGAFAYILKPYEQAVRDGDQIRAVIRGSAVNQDGASNGITSPNAEAQRQLILNAIKDAHVNVEDIGYIEAHGTATKLGDPIEVDGITRAFRSLTEKKQFCAIGTLKSNIGHLDNVSGLGGLAKIILSMEHGRIPASINFDVPNRNISFIDGPVYVNSVQDSWKKNSKGTYIAGINSFGISGTNCHMIVESFTEKRDERESRSRGEYLLPISAASETALKTLAGEYLDFINGYKADLDDLVYTSAVGRNHYEARLIFAFTDKEDLRKKIKTFLSGEEAEDGKIRFGFHRKIENHKKKSEPGDITVAEAEALTAEAIEFIRNSKEYSDEERNDRIASLYAAGADIPWQKLYAGSENRIVALPTYPFDHYRCWIESGNKAEKNVKSALAGKKQFETMGYSLNCFEMDSSLWELREHRVNDLCVLPGTGLIQRMVAGLEAEEKRDCLQLRNIVFHKTFAVPDHETRMLHMQIIHENDGKKIRFVSMNDFQEWMLHAEAELADLDGKNKPGKQNLQELKTRLSRKAELNDNGDEQRGILIAGRWKNLVSGAVCNEENTEFLIELELQDQYLEDLKKYSFHTALTDTAVNAVNNVLDNKKMYLPLQYGELNIYKAVPKKIYSYIKLLDFDKESMIQSFDITACDGEGNVLFEAKKYHIRAVRENSMEQEELLGHVRKTLKEIGKIESRQITGKKILAAGRFSEFSEQMLHRLADQNEIEFLNSEGASWAETLEKAEGKQYDICIYECASREGVSEQRNDSILKTFEFVKIFHEKKIQTQNGLVCLAKNSTSGIDGEQAADPIQSAIVGLWRTAGLEYEMSKMRSVDYEGIRDADLLNNEIFGDERPEFVLYREGIPYTVELQNSVLRLQPERKTLDPEGVYVITGGTGDLGLEAAGVLHKYGASKLVLLGRTPLPPRNEWQDKMTEEDTALAKKLKKLTELEKQYEKLVVEQVTIEDESAVWQLFERIRGQMGPIKGIMHLAGVAGDGFILNKDEKTFEKVYAPKANGLEALRKASTGDQLDFFICFSSAAAICYSAGQSDYTAANMYMDSYVEDMREKGIRAVSIQWPAWSETGIAYRMGAVDENEVIAPVKTAKALKTLETVMMHCEQIPPAVAPGKLEIKNKALVSEKNDSDSDLNVNLLGVEKKDEVYRKVGNIWAETLGIYEIDVDEEFHDLGGNSLLVSQMLRKYQEVYPNVMNIIDLFTYNTINKQVAYVKKQLHLEEAEEEKSAGTHSGQSDTMMDLDSILNSVMNGELSIEETYRLLEDK